jgi:outer membrane protein, multidrug efflux system
MRDSARALLLPAICCMAATVLAAATAPPAVPSPGAAAVPASNAVAEGTAAAAILDFWRALHDATLDRLLEEMLRGNLDVRAAYSRLDRARSERHAAELERLPTGDLAGDYTRQRLSPASFPGATGTFPDQSIWDVGLDLSWELDLSGRLRHDVEARRALAAASGASLRDVQVALAAELASSYFELRGAQEQRAVAERNAENQRRTLDLTRERLDAGRGTAFDTARAQTQLSVTSATVPPIEAGVAVAEYRIAVLLGRAPEAVAGELGTPAPLPSPPKEPAIADQEELIHHRPDVATAEQVLAAETAFVGAATAARRPRLTLGASAGYSAAAFDAIGEKGTFRYVLQTAISWPAFGLARVDASVAIARAQEEEARAGYEQALLRARSEVGTALVRYRAARSRLDQIRQAAASSTSAAELARLRFVDGLADLLDVLDAERTQLEAERQLAQARTEAATAYAEVFRALGGAVAP